MRAETTCFNQYCRLDRRSRELLILGLHLAKSIRRREHKVPTAAAKDRHNFFRAPTQGVELHSAEGLYSCTRTVFSMLFTHRLALVYTRVLARHHIQGVSHYACNDDGSGGNSRGSGGRRRPFARGGCSMRNCCTGGVSGGVLARLDFRLDTRVVLSGRNSLRCIMYQLKPKAKRVLQCMCRVPRIRRIILAALLPGKK